jgi:hypothetical protein
MMGCIGAISAEKDQQNILARIAMLECAIIVRDYTYAYKNNSVFT